MRNSKTQTRGAGAIDNPRALIAMVIFIPSFIFASWFTGYDKFMEDCTKNNTPKHCINQFRN